MLTRARFEDELKQAMRAGDDLRKRTLRMVLAAIKLAEVERRGPLDEAGLQAVLQREVKTRHETIADAEKAKREDLVLAAQEELDLLQAYLPQPLKPEELEALARRAIAATGASGPQDMGRVMKELMPHVQGRADGKAVSTLVRELLASS
ncbi:MAG TPA: GatB/YqeY domain-containing protein [Anaerolineales bacterium]|nr:GatB/YqeY domain-containing protein [Anaerolineales bacterium]